MVLALAPVLATALGFIVGMIYLIVTVGLPR